MVKEMAILNGVPALVTYPKHISVETIGSEGDYTVELPVGVNYHKLWIQCETSGGVALTKAQIEAAIDKVELLVDGDVKISSSATMLNNLRDYERAAQDGGSSDKYLLLDLVKGFKTLQQQYLLAYGTGNVNQMVLNIDVGDVTQLGKITVFAEVDNRQKVPLGMHLNFKSIHVNDEAAGEQDINSGLPLKGRNELLRRLFIMTSQCSKTRVELNGKVYFPNVPKTLNDEHLQHYGKTPISGCYAIDMSLHEDITAGIDLPLNEYLIRSTMDAATTGGYDVYFETIKQS